MNSTAGNAAGPTADGGSASRDHAVRPEQLSLLMLRVRRAGRPTEPEPWESSERAA